MSRSYKKHILINTCYGDNRIYYKNRRRKIKNLGRMQLRNLVANFLPEDVEDLWIEPKDHMRDTWDEPTDGHFGMSLDMYKARVKKIPGMFFDNEYAYEKEVKQFLKKKTRHIH